MRSDYTLLFTTCSTQRCPNCPFPSPQSSKRRIPLGRMLKSARWPRLTGGPPQRDGYTWDVCSICKVAPINRWSDGSVAVGSGPARARAVAMLRLSAPAQRGCSSRGIEERSGQCVQEAARPHAETLPAADDDDQKQEQAQAQEQNADGPGIAPLAGVSTTATGFTLSDTKMKSSVSMKGSWVVVAG